MQLGPLWAGVGLNDLHRCLPAYTTLQLDHVMFTFEFHLHWRPVLMFEWSPPALMNASLREDPEGDLNAPAMCEWGCFMPEVLTPWHEWNRHQFDDVANAEKRKSRYCFLVACFSFYGWFDSCTLVSTSSRKWAITPNQRETHTQISSTREYTHTLLYIPFCQESGW